ncbi:hypothetical protein PgNI_05159 [Pyricularia grisea]|uniref:Uncharacterized protein n=1 Tax=Pyricularia grisea TaxID=148305 RepID=A0A6P8B7I4_PYRGI|nr:hypothetical protein PgNI_05159 [Pyricularia grisea]TLD11203.1 hypothetical protein PgNI_05159 [Pyricularia grisea]
MAPPMITGDALAVNITEKTIQVLGQRYSFFRKTLSFSRLYGCPRFNFTDNFAQGFRSQSIKEESHVKRHTG